MWGMPNIVTAAKSLKEKILPPKTLLTPEVLKAAMPTITDARIALYIGPLNDTLRKYQINTPLRIAHFLAQIGHESASLRYMKEIGGSVYFKKYEGRRDLGNIYKGDGVKFFGRGAIQCTGRTNYTAYSKFVGIDFVKNPELLERPPYCIDVAGFYWQVQYNRNLNQYADRDDVLEVSAKVNGRNKKTGLPNHLKERKERLDIAKKALGIL